MPTFVINSSQNELYHHGVKGQKWGVRKDQNQISSIPQAKKLDLTEMQPQQYREFIDVGQRIPTEYSNVKYNVVQDRFTKSELFQMGVTVVSGLAAITIPVILLGMKAASK